MKKKVLGLIISVCVVIAMMSVMALAVAADEANTVIKVNGVGYTSFEEGWNAAIEATETSDETVNVELCADWSADSSNSFGTGVGFRRGAIYVPEDTTDLCFDLGGFTVDRKLTSAKKSGEVLQIDSGSSNITVKNGTITGANNKNYGGIYVDKAENVVFENVKFIGNKSSQGGALYNNEGKVTFVDCTFDGNQASYGGAVYSDYDTVKFVGCTFKNNSANSSGGAIYNYDANITVENSVFTSNKAIGYSHLSQGDTDNGWGGAIECNDGKTTVSGCTFEKNIAFGRGGAIHHREGELTVKDSTFKSNETKARGCRGGACYIADKAKFTNCTFEHNTAESGGAIYAESNLEIIGSTFRRNWAKESIYQGDEETGWGSVVAIGSDGDVTMKSCTVEDNLGHCAIFMYSTGLSEGELWLDGLMKVTGNRTVTGIESNIMCCETGIVSSSIFLKSGFSKDSIVGVGMEDNTLNGDEAVEKIPSGWTLADLTKCFKLDKYHLSGEYKDEFYLKKVGDSIEFKKGSPANDKNALVESNTGNTTGFILSEGSVAIAISVLSVIVSAATLTVVIVDRKKKKGADAN